MRVCVLGRVGGALCIVWVSVRVCTCVYACAFRVCVCVCCTQCARTKNGKTNDYTCFAVENERRSEGGREGGEGLVEAEHAVYG